MKVSIFLAMLCLIFGHSNVFAKDAFNNTTAQYIRLEMWHVGLNNSGAIEKKIHIDAVSKSMEDENSLKHESSQIAHKELPEELTRALGKMLN